MFLKHQCSLTSNVSLIAIMAAEWISNAMELAAKPADPKHRWWCHGLPRHCCQQVLHAVHMWSRVPRAMGSNVFHSTAVFRGEYYFVWQFLDSNHCENILSRLWKNIIYACSNITLWPMDCLGTPKMRDIWCGISFIHCFYLKQKSNWPNRCDTMHFPDRCYFSGQDLIRSLCSQCVGCGGSQLVLAWRINEWTNLETESVIH